MKKRKELNALIGLGDSKRKKTKKGSGHRLLRTEPPDSESESSSDDDEFNNLSSVAAFGKRSYAQCCNICYPLCVFIILAACVMACAGLIWMQIALKEDLDSLKEKLHTMESSQKVSSHEIPKLSEDLKAKQRKLEDLESGDKGLNKLWSNLTEINRKISLLDSAVNHLKANIKSASDLINLPTTVEDLQKSVATIGSTLTSVQHDVKTIQTVVEDQRKEVDNQKKALDHEGKELGTKSDTSAEKGTNTSLCAALKRDLVYLQDRLSEVNATQALHCALASNQIHSLHSSLSNLTQRVSSLEQSPLLSHVTQAPLSNASPATVDQDLRSRDPTEAAEGLVNSEGSTQSSSSKPTRRPRYLSQNRSKREAPGTRKTVTFVKDLEDFFKHAGLGPASPGVSYEELRNFFGASTPNARLLEDYDRDRNQKYTLAELRAAAEV